MKTVNLQHSAAFIAAATIIAIAAMAPLSVSAKSPTANVTIVNSGSIFTLGYTIVVSRSGYASYTSEGSSGTVTLPAGLVRKLFADIAASRPLGNLPSTNCLKSDRYGSFTHISLASDRSPDVSCPGNDRTTALMADAQQIAVAAHVDQLPRKPTRVR